MYNLYLKLVTTGKFADTLQMLYRIGRLNNWQLRSDMPSGETEEAILATAATGQAADGHGVILQGGGEPNGDDLAFSASAAVGIWDGTAAPPEGEVYEGAYLQYPGGGDAASESGGPPPSSSE